MKQKSEFVVQKWNEGVGAFVDSVKVDGDTADCVASIKKAGEAGKYRIVAVKRELSVEVQEVKKVSIK